MEIETKNASIDTLAVTIHALHVSGKQMTLAVFRQLPATPAFEPTGELKNLDFWGIVRYQVKDGSALWAVASANGILYRCDASPYRKSLAYYIRYLRTAQEELRQFNEWEPAAIRYAHWQEKRKTGDSDDFFIPAPPFPRQPNHKITFKIGERLRYEQEVQDCQYDLRIATMMEQSIDKLAKLPQLFIAV